MTYVIDSYRRLKEKPDYAVAAIKSLNKILGVDNVEIWIRRHDSDRPCEPLINSNASYIEYEEGAYFIVKSGPNNVAYFTLCQLRGCCGICMTTGESVAPIYRKLGVATVLGKFRKEIAKSRGFTVLLCTDVVTNIAQKKVLGKHGWQDVFRFRNRRTRNLVDISVVPLDPSYEAHTIKGEESCPTILNARWLPVSSSPLTNWLFSPFTKS